MRLFNQSVLAVFCSLVSSTVDARTLADLGQPTGLQSRSVFQNAPDGLTDITFAYDLSKVDHKYSWQFGAAFYFKVEGPSVGYLAIQPYDGYIRASFYIFIPGSTAHNQPPAWNEQTGGWNDYGCMDTADGVAGVTCHRYVWPANYDSPFYLTIARRNGRTWAGRITGPGFDETIAEVNLPHYEPIKPDVTYFLEALVGRDTCQGIPGTATTLIRPHCPSTGESAEVQAVRPSGGKCSSDIKFESNESNMGRSVMIQNGPESMQGKNGFPTSSRPQAPTAQQQRTHDAAQQEEEQRTDDDTYRQPTGTSDRFSNNVQQHDRTNTNNPPQAARQWREPSASSWLCTTYKNNFWTENVCGTELFCRQYDEKRSLTDGLYTDSNDCKRRIQ